MRTMSGQLAALVVGAGAAAAAAQDLMPIRIGAATTSDQPASR